VRYIFVLNTSQPHLRSGNLCLSVSGSGTHLSPSQPTRKASPKAANEAMPFPTPATESRAKRTAQITAKPTTRVATPINIPTVARRTAGTQSRSRSTMNQIIRPVWEFNSAYSYRRAHAVCTEKIARLSLNVGY